MNPFKLEFVSRKSTSEVYRTIKNFLATSRTGKSHYEILGVIPAASMAEVKSAYYKRAMDLHPDKVYGSREQFEELKIAYSILSDTEKRLNYDISHGINTPEGSSQRETRAELRGTFDKYNIDLWMKSHYTTQIKERKTFKCERNKESKAFGEGCVQREQVTMTLFFLIVLCTFAVSFK